MRELMFWSRGALALKKTGRYFPWRYGWRKERSTYNSESDVSSPMAQYQPAESSPSLSCSGSEASRDNNKFQSEAARCVISWFTRSMGPSDNQGIGATTARKRLVELEGQL